MKVQPRDKDEPHECSNVSIPQSAWIRRMRAGAEKTYLAKAFAIALVTKANPAAGSQLDPQQK